VSQYCHNYIEEDTTVDPNPSDHWRKLLFLHECAVMVDWGTMAAAQPGTSNSGLGGVEHPTALLVQLPSAQACVLLYDATDRGSFVTLAEVHRQVVQRDRDRQIEGGGVLARVLAVVVVVAADGRTGEAAAAAVADEEGARFAADIGAALYARVSVGADPGVHELVLELVNRVLLERASRGGEEGGAAS
jgi:hypothetical protein